MPFPIASELYCGVTFFHGSTRFGPANRVKLFTIWTCVRPNTHICHLSRTHTAIETNMIYILLLYAAHFGTTGKSLVFSNSNLKHKYMLTHIPESFKDHAMTLKNGSNVLHPSDNSCRRTKRGNLDRSKPRKCLLKDSFQ